MTPEPRAHVCVFELSGCGVQYLQESKEGALVTTKLTFKGCILLSIIANMRMAKCGRQLIVSRDVYRSLRFVGGFGCILRFVQAPSK